MTSAQVQSALEFQKSAFQQVVLLPNTLERNIVLAEHRTEIKRLEKVLAKSDK